MINPTQYIFINGALKMTPGKVAAQVAHAQEELTHKYIEHYRDQLDDYIELLATNPRTAIVLQCKDTEELYKIASYTESLNLLTGIYVDEVGDNYILEPTAMALEYVEKNDPRLEPLFSQFVLYDSQYWVEVTNNVLQHITKNHLTHGGRWRALRDLVEWRSAYDKGLSNKESMP